MMMESCHYVGDEIATERLSSGARHATGTTHATRKSYGARTKHATFTGVAWNDLFGGTPVASKHP